MTKTRVMYMHTIDGKPASYEPGYQIHFAQQGRYARKGIRLVASIADIHREQRESEAWRIKQGFSIEGWNYGYVRVEVPRV